MAEIIIKPLLYGVDFDSQTRELTFKRKDGAEIYSCTIPESGLVDDVTKPLMFKAVSDNSSVTLNRLSNYNGTYSYSLNNLDWGDYTYGTTINLRNGECVFFKVNSFGNKDANRLCQFSMTGTIEAWHNTNSMMVSENFESLTDLSSVGNYALLRLFQDCASLVKAPLLPATVLTESCYSGLFDMCVNLVHGPTLPATTLAKVCYSKMFNGASSLNTVTCYATDISAMLCTRLWLNGVSATGDFYTPQSTNWTTGADGLPANWSRIDI